MTDRRDEFDANPEAATLDTAGAFSLLGDPIRLDIVRALWAAGRGTPLSFSDLYDRVDVSDTGKLNYHRDQLIPYFVRKSDGGYRLTQAGERVARAVSAGAYSAYTELAAFDVRGSCYDCGVASLRGAVLNRCKAVEFTV